MIVATHTALIEEGWSAPETPRASRGFSTRQIPCSLLHLKFILSHLARADRFKNNLPDACVIVSQTVQTPAPPQLKFPQSDPTIADVGIGFRYLGVLKLVPARCPKRRLARPR